MTDTNPLVPADSHPTASHPTASLRLRRLLGVGLASTALLLGACSADETTFDENDPIPNEGDATEADGAADGVVDGTEDGFGPAEADDPTEGNDIDSDGTAEISPEEAEN